MFKAQVKNALRAGAVLATVMLAACGGRVSPELLPPGGLSAAVAPRTTDVRISTLPAWQQSMLQSLAGQITAHQLPDGALLNTSSQINGYFGNYAATGLVLYGNVPAAQRWAQWYVAHLNASGVWGSGCTIYDYNYANGVETSSGTASSVDAHSASFLTLLRALYQESGNSSAMAYVAGLKSTAECVALSLTSALNANNLVNVKPGDNIEYLIDNAQVFRGLGDIAWLETNVWKDSTHASLYLSAQTHVKNGIAALWNPGAGMYAAYTTTTNHIETPSWSTFYADSVGQIFLVVDGVLLKSNSRAQALYSEFNAAWPNWTLGPSGNPTGFPWAVVAQAAAAMGDTTRAQIFETNMQTQFGAKGWPWTWYDYESGSLMHAIARPVYSI